MQQKQAFPWQYVLSASGEWSSLIGVPLLVGSNQKRVTLPLSLFFFGGFFEIVPYLSKDPYLDCRIKCGFAPSRIICRSFWMKPGTPLLPLNERIEYLKTSSLYWSLGWGLWMICAILLVFFIASLTYHLEGFCKAFAKLGLILTVAGAVIDTLCEVIHITILPYLASQDPFPAHVFYGFDRLANAGGVIIANGFYCIAVLLITASLKQAQKINALTTFMGYETFLAGMIMVAGSFLNQTHIVEWSTGPTIVGYMIWTILLTRTLLQEQDSSQ